VERKFAADQTVGVPGEGLCSFRGNDLQLFLFCLFQPHFDCRMNSVEMKTATAVAEKHQEKMLRQLVSLMGTPSVCSGSF
jgi:hypothetical protein